MSDIVFVYPQRLVTTMDTAIRFPPAGGTPPPQDGILQIDNSSFIFAIDNSTIIIKGH